MLKEIPAVKPLEKSSINTLAVNTQIKPPLKIPLKDSCKLPVKRQIVKDIKHSQFIKYFIQENNNITDSYLKSYNYTGSRTQAGKNGEKILKRIMMDLEGKKRDFPLLYTQQALQNALRDEGLTVEKIAKTLKSLLDGVNKKGENAWKQNEGLDKLIRIFGAYAPTKQEIVHITPATSKDVAVELFRMFENSGYMRFIEQSVKVYKAGGKPEDVSIEADFTVEDTK